MFPLCGAHLLLGLTGGCAALRNERVEGAPDLLIDFLLENQVFGYCFRYGTLGKVSLESRAPNQNYDYEISQTYRAFEIQSGDHGRKDC